MGARIVWVAQVKLEGMGTLDVAFAQLPSLPGRQFTHDLLAFTQAQSLHKPVLACIYSTPSSASHHFTPFGLQSLFAFLKLGTRVELCSCWLC